MKVQRLTVKWLSEATGGCDFQTNDAAEMPFLAARVTVSVLIIPGVSNQGEFPRGGI